MGQYRVAPTQKLNYNYPKPLDRDEASQHLKMGTEVKSISARPSAGMLHKINKQSQPKYRHGLVKAHR